MLQMNKVKDKYTPNVSLETTHLIMKWHVISNQFRNHSCILQFYIIMKALCHKSFPQKWSVTSNNFFVLNTKQ